MSSGVTGEVTHQQQEQQQDTTTPQNEHSKELELNKLNLKRPMDYIKNGVTDAVDDNPEDEYNDDEKENTPGITNINNDHQSKKIIDKSTTNIQNFNTEESNIPTPNSVVDPKEDTVPLGDESEAPITNNEEYDTGNVAVKTSGNDNVNEITDANGERTPSKRKDSEAPEDTPKPKRSRKLQGAGVKKPLYSRYESLYIVKAFKTISDRQPNLVLIDLFKIVAILFNEEANRQGFKERTPDQLYQKYKRIQHGLNHGETEFLDFFKQNKHNKREWFPDFTSVENDQILKYIKFPKLDEAVKEVLGSSIANLKPPLPDLYDDEDDDDKKSVIAPGSQVGDVVEESGEAEEELLKLAGYEAGNGSGSHSSMPKELKARIKTLEASIGVQQKEIDVLREGMVAKDQEIIFLKNMIKEDLSYIRHKLNEPDFTNTKVSSSSAKS